MQQWKSKLGILTPKHVDVTINGTKHKCYPMSGKMLGRLRPVIARLGATIGAFMSTVSKSDAGTCERQIQDGDDLSMEIISDPLSPEMVDKRVQTRKASIVDAVDSLLSEETLCVAAELIMDCFREVFPRDAEGNPVDWPSPELFVEETEVFLILDMLQGVWEANKKVFNPFSENLKPLVMKAKAKMMSELEEDEDSPLTKSGTPSNDPTDGSPAEETTEA